MKAPALPRWADVVVLPLVNLAAALLIAGLVMALIGQDPRKVLALMADGAFGSARGFSYTLYYTTTFIFTGLAVAVAAHGGLFNIGAEGQATLGGLGAGLMALWLANSLPAAVMLPLMIVASIAFGAAWALIPAYLQAYRGSHIVITTIMFNFIAYTLLVYLLVNVLKAPGSMAVESAPFAASANLPTMKEALAWFGVEWPSSPLNLSFLLALLAAALVYAYLWHTRAGYRLRTVGANAGAAEYAGIPPAHQVLIAMAISGALAGMVGVNEIAGVNRKLLLDYVAGAGFTGIAVAMMGRNHPVGILLASLLFGALFQGGAEVSFEMPTFTRDMVVSLQGLVILFSGAMAYVLAPTLSRAIHALPPFAKAKAA
jgi:general nucleoside transport system permease protein